MFHRATTEDYKELVEWWKAHGWDAPPIEILPFGVVYSEDGVNKAAGFLYTASNAPVGYLEYIVANPENSGRESYKAVDAVIAELLQQARYSLIKCCFSRIQQDGLEKLYKKNGFHSGDKVKDMIWGEF